MGGPYKRKKYHVGDTHLKKGWRTKRRTKDLDQVNNENITILWHHQNLKYFKIFNSLKVILIFSRLIQISNQIMRKNYWNKKLITTNQVLRNSIAFIARKYILDNQEWNRCITYLCAFSQDNNTKLTMLWLQEALHRHKSIQWPY